MEKVHNKRTRHRLVMMSLLLLLAINVPLIWMWDQPLLVGGIPLLYLGLFVTWGVFIGGLVLISSRSS